MRRALALAARAEGETSPNPLVGALIATADGEIVAHGYHARAGAPHAEALAIERAGSAARGATLYVTLEPCAHHGRTPPCVDAIVRAGIARVVIAALDEDPNVAGGGAQRLRQAGVAVDVGVLRDAALRLNRMYFKHRRTGRPFVTLKMAQSLDGAIGARLGTRVQLTGLEAAKHVWARLRHAHDAVMVGVETVVVDDPLLTVRPHSVRAVPYTRVVVDARARVPLDRAVVADLGHARTIVAITGAAPPERVKALDDAGVETLTCATDPQGRVALEDLLAKLGARGMLGLLCEGGPTLAGALLTQGLVDELQWFIAPVVLGTATQAPVIRGLDAPVRYTVERVDVLGEDVLIIATVTPPV